MPTKELLDYLIKEIASGRHELEIRAHVKGAGWSDQDYMSAMAQLNSPSAGMPAVASEVLSVVSAKRFGRRWLLGIVLVLLGLLIASGVYAYFYFFPSLEKVGERMLSGLVGTESFELSGTLEAEISGADFLSVAQGIFQDKKDDANSTPGRIAGAQTYSGRLDFNGRFDGRDQANPSGAVTFTITAESMIFGMETVAVGKDMYFKITQFPAIGLFDAGQIKNQWFYVDEKFTKENQSEDEITPEQTQRVLEILKDAKIFDITERMSGEVIDGVSTIKYKYSVNKDELKQVIYDLYEVIEGEKIDPEYDSEFKDINQSLQFTGGELWVGRWDFKPRKMTFSMNLNGAAGTDMNAKLNLTTFFKNFDTSLKIEAPYPFKNVSEIQNIFSNSTESDARDATRLTDIRQLQTGLELYYNDYDEYPAALNEVITYLYAFPTAPTPPDGQCTSEQNSYTYKRTSRGTYTLNFCLGDGVSFYESGIRTAWEGGIK